MTKKKKSRAQRKKNVQQNVLNKVEDVKEVSNDNEKIEKPTLEEDTITKSEDVKEVSNDNEKIEKPTLEEDTITKSEDIEIENNIEDTDTSDKDSLSKVDRVFKVILTTLIGVFAVLIVIVGFSFINLVRSNNDVAYTYNNSKDSAIFNGNSKYFTYFKNNVVNKTYITSPYTMQMSLYNYQVNASREDSNILSAFENGYKNWGTSNELFKSDYFHLITLGTNADIDISKVSGDALVEELQLRVANKTNNYIEDLDLSKYADECKILGVLGLNIDMYNSRYNEYLGLIYYDGTMDFCSVNGIDCYCIPLKDNYKLYLLKGDVSQLSLANLTSDFTSKKGVISIKPNVYCIKSTGDGIVRSTDLNKSFKDFPEYSDYVGVVKFGFDCAKIPKTLEEMDCMESFVNDYTFVVENEQGQYVLLGYVNE